VVSDVRRMNEVNARRARLVRVLVTVFGRVYHGMVWYGMVNVDLYSAIITEVYNALNTLVSGEKPGFQTRSKGLIALLCAEVVRQRVPDQGAVYRDHLGM